VLLTSIPTVGIIGMLLRMLRRHPASTLKALLLMNPWYFVSTPALAKDYLFSDDYPDEKFLEYYRYIQPESFRMALEAAFLRLPRPGKIKTPLLVLGAENDRVFTVAEQRNTARAYKTEAILYSDMAHDMMLEAGWRSVADQILSWLNSRGL
jgi:alpha-beta hydrolase superfamily lysophospholipase